MSKLVEKEDLYRDLENLLQHPFYEIYAIYEPDGSDFLGDCYRCAVDLFTPGLTFQIWFKKTEDGIKVRYGDLWRFG